MFETGISVREKLSKYAVFAGFLVSFPRIRLGHIPRKWMRMALFAFLFFSALFLFTPMLLCILPSSMLRCILDNRTGKCESAI
jgi:hypothetical protein